MKVLKHLFENNRKWASNKIKNDADFFKRLSQQQNPDYLWIGCSDSRVPANQIVGLPPGEVFVHRNVANLIVEKDLNCLSVIQFAVEALKVKHIIVCGHYGCGGVKTVMENKKIGLIDNWLANIHKIKEKYDSELSEINNTAVQLSKMCELNVIEQVKNVCNTEFVQSAWQNNQSLSVHGWIYDISDGLLQDLEVCITSHSELKDEIEKAIRNIFTYTN
ncbi:MAG: carbonate dehydratase [Ignavibacteriaceae bacterium]|nr:carbonate dehydratase [Ignavibacteriaceae bacterium]